jgi:hypothetical protein
MGRNLKKIAVVRPSQQGWGHFRCRKIDDLTKRGYVSTYIADLERQQGLKVEKSAFQVLAKC